MSGGVRRGAQGTSSMTRKGIGIRESGREYFRLGVMGIAMAHYVPIGIDLLDALARGGLGTGVASRRGPLKRRLLSSVDARCSMQHRRCTNGPGSPEAAVSVPGLLGVFPGSRPGGQPEGSPSDSAPNQAGVTARHDRQPQDHPSPPQRPPRPHPHGEWGALSRESRTTAPCRCGEVPASPTPPAPRTAPRPRPLYLWLRAPDRHPPE